MTTFARDLSARLADLLRNERAALAEFLVALADFDGRRLWESLGHASLFSFLTRDLGLSKGAAFYRLTAAQLIQRHPDILEPLRDGRLCLTTVVAISKVLTPENCSDVLPRFFHLSRREAEEVRVEIRPELRVPARAVVTPVRPAAQALALTTSDFGQEVGWPTTSLPAQGRPTHEGPSLPPPPRMSVEPKTADESRLHLTVPRSLLRKLEEARAALSHSHPGASPEEILELGLDLILERQARRRGLVKKPRKSKAESTAQAPRQARGERVERYVPADVRRAVWKRDGGRCQFPLEGGGVCGSTHRLEIDHIQPTAQGGESTIENCRLTCRPHNVAAARKAYGDALMDRYTASGRRTPPPRPVPASVSG